MRPIQSSIKDQELLAARRKLIVAASTELFIKHGFDGVSVKEIAEASGMGIGLLYKYIRAKEDILWLVMDQIYGELEERLLEEKHVAGDPEVALKQVFGSFLRAVDAVRHGALLMYREYRELPADAQREFMDRERRIMSVFAEVIRDGVEAGVFDCGDPEMASLNLIMMGHTRALKRWFAPHMSIDEYVTRQTTLAFRFVSKNQAP